MSETAKVSSVTIICPQYPPEKGAAASRLARLATGLRARGVTVNVVTALPNYPTGRIFPAYRGKFRHSETIDEIKVRRYWLYPSNSAKAVKRILNMVSLSVTLLFSFPYLLRNRPQIIIVNSPPLPVAMSGVLLAKLLNCRVIMNVSDIWPMSALELGSINRGTLYSLLEGIERWLYRRSDAVIAQSRETRNHVLDFCPDKEVFLYRNLDPLSSYLAQYPSIETSPTKVVYAGLLGVAQGVYEICRQVDFRSMSVEFHIYGDGIERSIIEQHVANNPDCNIYLHGSVAKAEMPEILSRFHGTVIPLKAHLTGAFPSKIYMAMSASLPVVFCGSGEGAQFVRDSGIGWVTEPGNYKGLSKLISELSSMAEDDYRSLRNSIANLASTKYDLQDQLDRLQKFLNDIK